MNGALRTTAVVILVGVTAVATMGAATPKWAGEAGLDVWGLSSLRTDLLRSAELDEERDAARASTEVRGQLVEELIAGRLSLAEVAEYILQLNRDRTGWLVALRLAYPTAVDDRERAARSVLAAVEMDTIGDPSRQSETNKRLRAELMALAGQTH
ncbi:MAG: hypothetical protein JWO38_4444 [Gemmataceae bacterium]|nr:hypothetical protein [Gemmataceae bacterium]